MNREYHRWRSAALDRDIELLVFGHAGARTIAFPTSAGRFYDWENRGMVEALRPLLTAGELQLFCVDSVDRESWYNRAIPPEQRVARHDQYDRYILQEVLPFTEKSNPHPFVILTGASFGGYHALNFSLRHPESVHRVLSMSGLCDIRWVFGNHPEELVYFHNPVQYIANEHEPRRLEALRKLNIILAVGREDRLYPSNEQLSQLLWQHGIWHALRVWNGFAHDWPDWQRMLQLYIGGND